MTEPSPAAGPTPKVVGLVLAAGAGVRMGGVPKALVRSSSGRSWLAAAVDALEQGGATPVYVVIGAQAERVAREVPADCTTVMADGWREGMGASLRAGLAAVANAAPGGDTGPDAVAIMVVDTPDVGPDVVRRVASAATPDVLARAVFHGTPGHPVLIGRRHWPGVVETARGDRGARDYLSGREVDAVECGDLAEGLDVDTADAMERWQRRAGNP